MENPDEFDTIEITATTSAYAQRHANTFQALLNAFKSDTRDIATVVQAIRTLGGSVKEEAEQFDSAMTFPPDAENQNETQKQMAFSGIR